MFQKRQNKSVQNLVYIQLAQVSMSGGKFIDNIVYAQYCTLPVWENYFPSFKSNTKCLRGFFSFSNLSLIHSYPYLDAPKTDRDMDIWTDWQTDNLSTYKTTDTDGQTEIRGLNHPIDRQFGFSEDDRQTHGPADRLADRQFIYLPSNGQSDSLDSSEEEKRIPAAL